MESELEKKLTSSHKNDLILFMDSHPAYFDEAITLAISNKQPYSWRSAWLLWSYIKENDRRVQNHVQSIIDALPTKTDSHQRELLKILLQMKLNDKQEGYLFSHCISIWEKINKKPSVRFIAFKFIIKIVKDHPNLINELEFLTEKKYLDSLSEAAQKSISKMADELSNK